MKKIISVLAASVIMVSTAATSFASGFSDSVAKLNKDQIDIIYNGQLMTYQDATPELIKDRVMLPFRSALENMGAEVDYNGDTKLVTAKHNDTTITFKLEDSVIHVDKNGEKSDVTLNTPMVVKNDRTLVPIRFISSALGMQVGWDSDTKTVLIVDTESYKKELAEKMPNFMALTELEIPPYNTDATELSFKMNGNIISTEEPLNLAIDLSCNTKTAEDVSSLSGTINADIANLGLNIAPIENAEFEIILSDSKLYMKSADIIKAIAAANPEHPVIKALDSDKWFYVDMEALLDEIFADPETEPIKDIYKSILNGEIAVKDNLIDTIASQIDTTSSLFALNGDATVESAAMADVMVDAYALIDKYITVTDNKAEVKMDKDFIKDYMNMITASLGADEDEVMAYPMESMMDMLTFDIEASAVYDDTSSESKSSIVLGINDEDVKINLTLDISETAKLEEDVTPAEIPEDAVDLMGIIQLLASVGV